MIHTIFSAESTTKQNLSQEVYTTLTSDHSNFILTEVSSHFSPSRILVVRITIFFWTQNQIEAKQGKKMLWRNTNILNKNDHFSKWFYLHFSYTSMLNGTFWLIFTPVWITWIKDTDVLHMMKCKTINPKLWSPPLNPHTASGLLLWHLKFKVFISNRSYLNKHI